MARTTYKVIDLVVLMNARIKMASTPETRWALADLLETILLSTGRYKGFRYLDSEFDGRGRLRPDYDDTMRSYYGG